MKNVFGIFLMLFVGCVSFAQPGDVPRKFEGSVGTEVLPCSETLYSDNEVTYLVKGAKRIITTNAIPEHEVGVFLKGGKEKVIEEQEFVYKLPLNPQKESKFKHILSGYEFGTGKPTVVLGVAINGVKLNPASLDAFRNTKTGELNFFWAKDALGINKRPGIDCNSGDVTENGEYQYRGIPQGIMNTTGESMFLVGWAADGFPMYYKYGYEDPMNSKSALVELIPSYSLKVGDRGGDGVSAPNGKYDGTYIRDYQFIEGSGDLDKANGRYGVTPEFPQGTYYYVITDEYPSLPRYLAGSVAKQFEIKMEVLEKGMRPQLNSQSGRPSGGGQRGGGSDPISELDANGDGKLSKSEVKGPLINDFDKLDVNGDGFLSKEEIPQQRQQQQRPQQRR